MGKKISIMYKEWLKTRLYVACLLAVVIGATVFALVGVFKTAEFGGIASLWSEMLEHDGILVDNLKYIPPIAGLLLAMAQFVPETQQKRLKLTLHLPYSETRILLLMLGYGIGIMAITSLLQLAAIGIGLRELLPWILVKRILLTMLPWYINGITVYIWLSAVCIEPVWRRRILYLLVTAGLTYAGYLNSAAEAYNYFLPLMVLWTICSISMVFTSVGRFKEGKQD